jgi:DNA invertase Pin-like site-specific DNA recombinase
VHEIYCDEQVPLHAARPQFDHALAALHAGDTLVVCRLIHICRSLEHLTVLMIQLDQRGVRLLALHEQLDTVEHGELLRQVTQGLIEARRSWRSETTREGLATGRPPGRPPGPPILTQEQHQLALELREGGLSVVAIADLIGVSRARLYRALAPDATPSTGKDSAP